MESGIQVLVQGTAEVDDRDLDANAERYWRESWEKLPGDPEMHPPKLLRSWFTWYYTRLYVLVRPERVFVWPDGDLTAEPEIHDAHLEEVRSGHVEEPPEDHGRPAGGDAPGTSAWMSSAPPTRRAWSAGWPPTDSRSPCDCRSRSTGTPARSRCAAEPAGVPLIEGRACLTCTAIAPDFTWQRNFQVRGDLEQSDGAGG